MEQHVETAAVHRVLRPTITGLRAARLGIDVVSVEPDQRPFLRRQANLVEIGRADAEIVKLAHRIRLQVDADAERAHLAHRLEDDGAHADLMERERGGQPADAATGDKYRSVRHAALPSPMPPGFFSFRGAPGASRRGV